MQEKLFAELIDRGVESETLDYKTHMSWHTMPRAAKGKLIRHLTAFANTRGGYLVIGVSEDSYGNPTLRTGVSEEEAGSFDPTAVGNFANSCVEPPIDFTIERPVIRGKHYVIFVVRPFKEIPHVCSMPIEGELQSGVFYIRTQEASSRPARRVFEMQALIRRAMRNSREELGRLLRGILYENWENPQDSRSVADERNAADDILEECGQYFFHRVRFPEAPCFRLSVLPSPCKSGTFPMETLSAAVEASWRERAGAEFTGLVLEQGRIRRTPGALRVLSRQARKMWHLADSGLFCFFWIPSETALTMEFDRFVRFCADVVDFLSRLYTELGWSEELLTLRLEIRHSDRMTLIDRVPTGDKAYPAAETAVSAEICRSAADLVSGSGNHTIRLVRRIGEAFRLPDQRLDDLGGLVRDFLEQR